VLENFSIEIFAFLAFEISIDINDVLDEQKSKNHMTSGNTDVYQEKKSQNQVEREIT
jgi:hypothetical protein